MNGDGEQDEMRRLTDRLATLERELAALRLVVYRLQFERLDARLARGDDE